MQRLIPLAVLALAPVVAVGCEQTPVEPFTAETDDQTALFSAQPATVTTVPISGTTDLCGYDTVDYEGTFRVVLRESVDETGTKRSHYLEPFQIRVRGVGQATGDAWIGSVKSSFADNYIDGGEPQTFNLVQQTKWVGLGQAPNFVSTFRGHLTINGNGELVLFRVDFTDACN